jgi:hypothetical protein
VTFGSELPETSQKGKIYMSSQSQKGKNGSSSEKDDVFLTPNFHVRTYFMQTDAVATMDDGLHQP